MKVRNTSPLALLCVLPYGPMSLVALTDFLLLQPIDALMSPPIMRTAPFGHWFITSDSCWSVASYSVSGKEEHGMYTEITKMVIGLLHVSLVCSSRPMMRVAFAIGGGRTGSG